MLEVVTLGQARFNCPGVAADERGVAMGRRILCLFADLQRALGFIRALSRAGALKDVLGTLELEEATALNSPAVAALATCQAAGRMSSCGASAAWCGSLM